MVFSIDIGNGSANTAKHGCPATLSLAHDVRAHHGFRKGRSSICPIWLVASGSIPEGSYNPASLSGTLPQPAACLRSGSEPACSLLVDPLRGSLRSPLVRAPRTLNYEVDANKFIKMKDHDLKSAMSS